MKIKKINPFKNLFKTYRKMKNYNSKTFFVAKTSIPIWRKIFNVVKNKRYLLMFGLSIPFYFVASEHNIDLIEYIGLIFQIFQMLK
ncbi:MAG: hypothetical protein AB8G11_02230 [Saprospiraceae bacterium]